MRTDIAELLIDIEASLRQLQLWESEPPPPESLVSTQPFCIDTLSFPQWLQFVFIPTIYTMLEEGQALPSQCAIAPMADEFFRGTSLPSADLLTALEGIDAAITGASLS